MSSGQTGENPDRTRTWKLVLVGVTGGVALAVGVFLYLIRLTPDAAREAEKSIVEGTDHIIKVVLAIGTAAVVLIAVLNTVFGGRKRKVTPQEWADELERHLLGTEGPWDWDDTTSEPLADPSLEQLRFTLPDFDLLNTPEKTEEFRRIIEALRRGEIPARR